jgi:ATP-binding cassette subfamily B protein
VEPGQTVAIVGPTGAGKTTLVNLLMRFYELDGGRILLDGQDIAELTRDDVRSRTGMVLQDPWLFAGTIRENIRYGNEEASDDEIYEAAVATRVDRFVHPPRRVRHGARRGCRERLGGREAAADRARLRGIPERPHPR